jgi:hypothetical protein
MTSSLPSPISDNLRGAGLRQSNTKPVSPVLETRVAAPVIVLTYAYSGAGRLQSLLARQPDIVCTSGTGVLPLCEQAASTWRATEGRPIGPLSALATASIRALTTTLILAILSVDGKRLWCETSMAPPSSLKTFLELFPGTRILCLHRACPDVIYDAVHASSWGLASGPTFEQFIRAYPASSIAALAAYWTTRADLLITMERDHPDICRRIRYEDLAVPEPNLFEFLGLNDPGADRTIWPITDPVQSAPAPPIPTGEIPPRLLEHANELMSQLGYPPMKATAKVT